MLHRASCELQFYRRPWEQLRHLIVVLVNFQNLRVFLFYSFVLYFFLYLFRLYQKHLQPHLFVVDDLRLYRQMVNQLVMQMVSDKEMNQLLDVNYQQHLLDVDYFVADVQQNLDVLNQDVHLTLADVVLVVFFLVCVLLHLDELVLLVDGLHRYLN